MHTDTQLLLRPPDKTKGKSVALSEHPLELTPLHAHSHQGDENEGRGNGEAFKVLRFARRVFGDKRDCRVEAGETGDAGANEEGEEERVEGCAEAEGKGEEGWRNSERDLADVNAEDKSGLLV